MRWRVKVLSRIIATILIFPLFVAYKIITLIADKNDVFATFSQLLSIIPGKIGGYIRVAFYRNTMTQCDPDCLISFATIFSQVDTEIEAGTYIGPQCNIGTCKIEKNCLIGSGVHILSGKNQHTYRDVSKPIKEQGGRYDKITVGEDSWIGNGAILMANVGKKCVVAAGAVVISDVQEYSVVGGNPAVVIKQRIST